MSNDTTTNLGLTVPIPGTNEPWSTATYRANWESVDAEIGTRRTADTALGNRVTTLEGWGAGRAGSGGGARYIVNAPSDLDALTTAKIGDTAYMISPGTGITSLEWVAVADTVVNLDWRPAGTVVAASKANLDAFIAVIAATTDLRFQIGATAIVTTAAPAIYTFSSVVGALVISSVGTNGRVLLQTKTLGAPATTFSTDAFVNSALFDHYELEFQFTRSVASFLRLRMRLAGADDSTAANYAYQTLFASGATVTGAAVVAGTTGYFEISQSTANPISGTGKMYLPGTAVAGRHSNFETVSISAAGAGHSWFKAAPMNYIPTTLVDAVTFVASAGNLNTGKVSVYGIVV